MKEPTKDSVGYSGLGLTLAREATKILNMSGNSVMVEQSKAAARKIFSEMLTPESELRSWRFTFELLGSDKLAPGVLDAAAMRRGAIQFIKLIQWVIPPVQGEAMLRSIAPLLRPLMGDPKRDKGLAVVELRARLESLIGGPQEAAAAVDAWLKVDETDPEAQLCAFCARVRTGPSNEEEMNRALMPAQEALHLTLDWAGMSGQLVRQLEARLSQTLEDAPARRWLAQMLSELRLVEKDG